MWDCEQQTIRRSSAGGDGANSPELGRHNNQPGMHLLMSCSVSQELHKVPTAVITTRRCCLPCARGVVAQLGIAAVVSWLPDPRLLKI